MLFMFSKSLVLYVSILILIDSIDYLTAERCDRTLSSVRKATADGRYRIDILDNPSGYVPGAKYTVTLYGIKKNSQNAPTKFTLFKLSVGSTNTVEDYSTTKYGIFLRNPNDTFSELECGNLLKHASLQAKERIEIEWVAPPAGSGCVVFRASVMENRDFWYMDDGPLSKEFCEDDSAILEKVAVNGYCCACSEAKYQFSFEGKWIRNTHPKNFPENNLVARFSDIIGASHSIDYDLWNYDDKPTEGLKELAESGNTALIEEYFKNEAHHIRTIIKARGLNVSDTGPTLAIFRVDPINHLVSFVSKIDPSPDWFVGVAKQDLCTPDCSWIEKKEFVLYPWDAGTDNGPSYLSPDEPARPYNSIRRIDTSYDYRSPFYSAKRERVAPFGRLILTRERIYPKSNCNTEPETNEPIHPVQPKENYNWNYDNTRKEGGNEKCHGQQCTGPINNLPPQQIPEEECQIGVTMSGCSHGCGPTGTRTVTITTKIDNKCNRTAINIGCNRYDCRNLRCQDLFGEQKDCKGERKNIWYYNFKESCCKMTTVYSCPDERTKNLFNTLNDCLRACYSQDNEQFSMHNVCEPMYRTSF